MYFAKWGVWKVQVVIIEWKILPQSADKSTGGAFRIQGTNVPYMEKTRHFVWHGFSQLIHLQKK